MPPRHIVRASFAAACALSLGLAVAACGDDTIDNPTVGAEAESSEVVDPGAETVVEPGAETATPVESPTALAKPTVELPNSLPTELVITDLATGTGAEAAVGDTVVVHYVGVRSADGTEFDNSYDRGSPFPVVLGQGSVIAGWDQGLIGARQGGRLQLDIPADLAYGDNPSGDVIQAGDALSFVIDVIAVLSSADPADAPDVEIIEAANQEELTFDDLVEGGGPVLRDGQTAAVQIVAYRADNAELITSTWTEGGAPFTFAVGSGDVLVGIDLGIEGMSVGGRRQVHVPFLMAFGETGNESFGLPPSTDMILIIDLVAGY